MPEGRDPGLLVRLQSDDVEARAQALDEVTANREASYLPYVVASLYHESPEIRHRAATALRGIKDPRVADMALMALVTEKSPDVIFDLILVFLYHPKEEAIDELLTFLDFPDFRIRSAAVDVLGALGGVYGRYDVIKPLCALLEDARPSVVMVTLRALLHTAESLEERDLLEEIAGRAERLEQAPNRMLAELASTVRQQIGKSLSMLGSD